jgi:diguanylate cyclase (GGDEF)-like protein
LVLPDHLIQGAAVEVSWRTARNLRRWTLLVVTSMVMMVIGATAASIWLQRDEALGDHQKATIHKAAGNLDDGASQQAPSSINSAERVPDAIGTDPDAADDAAAKEGVTQAPRDDWALQVFFVLFGAVSVLAAVGMLARYVAGQIDDMEQAKLTTARKNAELETAHRQLDAALANISLGVCFFDGDKKLVVCNQKYREIYDLPAEVTLPGTPVMDLMDHLFASDRSPRIQRDQYIYLRDKMVDTGKPHQTVMELMSGQSISVRHQPMPDGGWISTHEDITERQQADLHIRFLAHHDGLTGLANRALFIEKLDSAVAGLSRRHQTFAVFMIDLDRFKNVNDTLGHPAGDQLLREAAQRLKSALRETDVLARLGGDEFAIIQTVEEDPLEKAASLAEHILAIMREPFDIDGNLVSAGASIGIVLVSDPARSSDILKMADLALYEVKAKGRSDFRFFEARMLTALNDRRVLEDQLRDAIGRGEFELHYQAMIDVSTGRQAGFEALVRWKRPDGGIVMPDRFIPLAEETGLIVPLGEWILRRACADAAQWPAHIKVSVNLSPVQLAHPDLFRSILRALADSSLPPERLELEITETALFKNDADCTKLISELKTLGISIALDDFGTGYSSLSYLTMIAFDKIKIDRSFTMNMIARADCAAIVAAVVALGHSLNRQTVAEGVETEQQLAMLRAAGVTMVQGYLFGRPCPLSALVLDDQSNSHLFASAA